MYNMNTEVAAGIQKMPYEVVFGQPPRTTIIPGATVEGKIVNEEDIEIDIQETIPPLQVSGTSFSPSHSASANTSETLREIPIPGLCSASTPPEPHRERQIPVPYLTPTPPKPFRERPIPGTCSASTPPEPHIERPIPVPCSATTPPEPLRELPIQSTCSASTRPDQHRERPIPGTCLASTPSEPLRERPIPKPRRMKPVSNTDVPQASDYPDSNRPALEREVTHTILSTFASPDLLDVTSFPSTSSEATEVSRETTLPLPLAFAQLSRQPPTVLSISPACEANEATRTILTSTPMFEHSNSEQPSQKSEGSGNAPSKSHPLRSTSPSSLPSTVCAPDLPPSFPDVSMPSVIASTASPSYTLATNTKHHQIRQEADKAYRRNAESMKQKYSKRKRTTCTSFEVGDMVTLRIPRIDRSGTDQPRIMGKIVDVRGETDKMFKVQCEFGIIDGWYRSGDLMPFNKAYDQEFNKRQKISVREASLKMNPNMVTRKKCSCKQNCSKNCYCVRNKLKCSSHCHPSRTCTNIETSALNLHERKKVEDKECLTDKHMTASQNMLKHQFPTNHELYDTLLTNTVNDEPTPYIQIHHINGNLWVTAAAYTKDGAIELYDSLITGKATSDTLKNLRNFPGKNAQVKTMNIQQQCGNRDCALFAVANATSICHGEDPTAIHYLQEEMRGHFLTCIESGTLTMFPHEIKKERYKRRVKFVQ